MTDYIYVPLMIYSPSYRESFFPKLAHSIEKFDTPEGVKITRVYDASDSLMELIFEMIQNRNQDDVEQPLIVLEKFNMLRVEVETEELLRFQPLPWLEKQIKDFVRNYDDFLGLYFFWLEDSQFYSFNIAKIYNGDEVTIVEDQREDNFDVLTSEFAPFLRDYWYWEHEVNFLDTHPAILAKICLLFED